MSFQPQYSVYKTHFTHTMYKKVARFVKPSTSTTNTYKKSDADRTAPFQSPHTIFLTMTMNLKWKDDGDMDANKKVD